MLSEYHGIIVQEGFRDQVLLQKFRILGKKTGKSWSMVKIGVEPEKFEEIIRIVQKNLLTENNVPYYAHFYRNNELIIIFPAKIFHVTLNRESWYEVISYGRSLGIPEHELDFKPARIEDETY